MRSVRTILFTVSSLGLLTAFGAAAIIYLGVFNVAANEPHWPLTTWVLEKARLRSIQVHAAGLSPPAGYDGQARIVMAVGHFSEHCAMCHGGPGLKKGDVAEGMYPQPPDLKHAAERYGPGELFWILKNGIKMSGMPSMSSDGDDMLWATVAFLQKLPKMSHDDYNELWMLSQAAGADGSMDHGPTSMGDMGAKGHAAGQSKPGNADAGGARPDGGPQHQHGH